MSLVFRCTWSSVEGVDALDEQGGVMILHFHSVPFRFWHPMDASAVVFPPDGCHL